MAKDIPYVSSRTTGDGKTIWVLSTKNAWTGKMTERRFSSETEIKNFLDSEKRRHEDERKLMERKNNEGLNPRISVHGLLKAYFRARLHNRNSVVQNGYHASQVVEMFGRRKAMGITPNDIRNFMEIQRRRGCSQITINRRVAILRTAISWAVAQGAFPENRLAEIQLPRAVPKRIQPPTPDELRKMLQVAPKHVFRTILLGLYTGARVGPSELFRLEWDHIDLWNRIINLPCAEKNKHITTRIVPINDLLMGYLPAWKNEDERRGICWVIHYGMKPIRTLGRAWRQTMERAGISRNFRPYDLRHAYATYAIAHGADIKTVAEIMGHTDASMILRTYQHVQPEQKRKAMESIPAIV